MKRMTGNFPHGGTTMDDHFDRMRLLIQVHSSAAFLPVSAQLPTQLANNLLL